MSTSGIAAATLAAYRAARYRVLTVPEFSLQIDQHDASLAALMARCHQQTAALVTAFNPWGEVRSADANLQADATLQALLLQRSLPLFPTIASDPEGVWPDEQGWLVIGLRREDAIDIGRLFRQNAILWADEDAVVRLVVLR